MKGDDLKDQDRPGWWIGFWEYLGDFERKALLTVGDRRIFEADVIILHEFDPSNHVVILMSGWVKVTCTDSDGREVILALRGPGDILGEMEVMLDDPRRSAMVRALHNEVDVAVIPSLQFKRFLEENPVGWHALYRVLAYRLRQSNRNAREFGLTGVRQALARLLLDLASRHGVWHEDGSVTVSLLSQDEIAACIWASRDAVAHELKSFRARGLLRTGRRSFALLNVAMLERIAQSGEY